MWEGIWLALSAKSGVRKCWSLLAYLLQVTLRESDVKAAGLGTGSMLQTIYKSPTSFCWGQVLVAPDSLCEDEKQGLLSDESLFPKKSMAGGKILGHGVPAKTSHIFSPLGEALGSRCESE